MKGWLLFLAGLGVGIVLGARWLMQRLIATGAIPVGFGGADR